MLEKYYKYKVKYNDYLLLIKIGNFYEVFDNDSLIFNKVFNYKLKPIKDTFKCGFPINSLDNVLSILNNNQINYLVIDEEIIKEEKFIDNNYTKFNININILKYNYSRVNRIINYLNENIVNDISDEIDLIEDIIKVV